MSNSDVFWLADPNIRDFFMRFPLPLAVLDKDGSIRLLNKRFTATFDSACLKSEKLRQMLLSPDNLIQAITLLQRNDCLTEVYARTINIDDDVILILDESAETAYTDDLSELRERITELEKLIANDRLTGVWNRAHFDKIFKMELSRSVRYRQPVALIFLDVDRFQPINDSHGCEAGDEVLCELVKVISKNIRASDMLFRWEGAQFAILAPSTSRHSAASLAETLRSKIEQHEIATVGHITISLGVAEHVSGESAETWFQRADEALHSAKSSGRNRVIVDQHGGDLSDQDNALLRLERHDFDAGIDPQERKLFDLANMLIDAAITRKANSREFNEALQTLLKHVEQHFTEE